MATTTLAKIGKTLGSQVWVTVCTGAPRGVDEVKCHATEESARAAIQAWRPNFTRRFTLEMTPKVCALFLAYKAKLDQLAKRAAKGGAG